MLKASFIAITALAAALVVGLVVSAEAAPVIAPGIGAPETCIKYGSAFTVTGGDFAPGTPVTITAPVDRYIGAQSGYSIKGDHAVATADATGAFHLRMRAPTAIAGLGAPRYQPRTIYATTADGPSGAAFILIATRAACNYLDRPAAKRQH